MTRATSVGFLLLSPICTSLTGMFIKFIPWSPWAIVGWRSLFSSLFILAVFKTIFPKEFRFDWSGGNLLVAASYSAFALLFSISTKLTTSANAVFLQYTAPAWVALLGPWLLGEKTSRLDWLFLGLTVTGLSLFLLNDFAVGGGRNDPLGLAAGLAGGLAWGLCVIFMRRKGSQGPPLSAMVIANGLTALYCLGAMFSVDFSAPGDLAANLGWCALLGIGPLGLGYVFYVLAINQVTALEAAMIPAIEPLLNPIWTFLAVGERPGFWTFIGGGLVLAGVLARSWLAVKSPPSLKEGSG